MFFNLIRWRSSGVVDSQFIINYRVFIVPTVCSTFWCNNHNASFLFFFYLHHLGISWFFHFTDTASFHLIEQGRYMCYPLCLYLESEVIAFLFKWNTIICLCACTSCFYFAVSQCSKILKQVESSSYYKIPSQVYFVGAWKCCFYI